MTFTQWLYPDLKDYFDSLSNFSPTLDKMIATREMIHYGAQNLNLQDVRVEEHYVKTRDGFQNRVLVCRPAKVHAKGRAMLWFHGGGMVIGNPDNSVGYVLDFVRQCNAVVVIPTYRLAPEFPYPYAFHDCYDSLLWLSENAELLNINRSNIATAGASAGGNLCIAVNLFARDHHGPKVAFQCPLYPMLDYRNSFPSNEISYPKVWNREKNELAWQYYLQQLNGNIPYTASPILCDDWRNSPPTYTFIGTCDLFRDETMYFVQELTKANVPTEFHLYNGGTHGFEMIPNIPFAQHAKKQFIQTVNSYYERYGI